MKWRMVRRGAHELHELTRIEKMGIRNTFFLTDTNVINLSI